MFNWHRKHTNNEPIRKTKILFLASNPIDTNRIQLDEEARLITQKLRASDLRDSIEFISAWAIRTDDLIQLLNEHQPSILHFSGHGNAQGELILVDADGRAKPVSPDSIRSLLKVLKGNIRLVILNACFSSIQSKAVSELVDCTIGMDKSISDQAAMLFAASFYRAIGFGLSVKESFEQGITAIQLEGINETNTPELFCAGNVDPLKIVLASKGNTDIIVGDQWANKTMDWIRYMYDGENDTVNFNELESLIRSLSDIDLYSKARSSLDSRDYVRSAVYWSELYRRDNNNPECRSYFYLSLSKIEREQEISYAMDSLLSQAQSAYVLERYDDALDRLQIALTLSHSVAILLKRSSYIEEFINDIKSRKKDEIEHLIMIAQEHLQRQDFISAALILLDAQRKFPDSAEFPKMLNEARNRIITN